MTFKRLRGTHDIFGEDAAFFSHIETTARAVFENFGFEEIRTPILEEKEVFTRALGTETDVVQKEMYEFVDRSETSVAMRPEGTAGVVRAYLENNLDKTHGLAKLYYMGAMFRSERPQAGRLRQFHQIGVEQLGTYSPLADAETIHSLCALLDKLGISGYKLKLNNLGTFEEREGYKKKLVEYFTPLKSNLCEDCQKRLTKNVFRLLDCKVESCKKIVHLAPKLLSFLTEDSHQYFDKVRKALESIGIAYEIDEFLVRGLDYYTKTVFEVTHSALGSQDAIAAGGRYDKLIGAFGGTEAGAVGFALGIERLILCLKGTALPVSQEDSYFIAVLGDQAMTQGLKLLSRLRVQGLRVGMDYEGKSLKSQMRAADKAKSRFVIILGDNELQKGIFILKDMKDGSQKEINLTQTSDFLRKKD